MRETFKDFQIEGRTYRVEKLSVQDGAWLWFFLSARMKTPDLHDALAAISETEFQQIADKVFAKTFLLSADTGLPVPVRHASGKVVDELLASDSMAYFDLMFQAIGFNLAPFFERALKEAKTAETQ